ncbi:TPA: TIGR02680 family protein [Burkholderia cepacia ATCC 25416]|uniref:TIGR02680 family protein n=1 Tax=Burkholderia cepacia TaxID=292 RepID=UPI000F5EBC3C|nr:TIGR02680 family protein [Burkholderia cepacia]HDR9764878.1 TIGR02680 family protein [Burkholderia cepacia ATCC 25416]MCA8028869.1 TIGR02680 family protein [Burkholderia cepacia]RRA21067.1 TIGR02680 family protein [Burkholderia cepacia]HDR9773151.1 TIGR02680 family protein [Burkholderia cepacia ATCC 25416]HDR9781499.1 TIGR02680 family protein [Burkholderia cepacia ATCC 25416]
MSEDDLFQKIVPTIRADLPEPVLERWQPLRLGVVELFHYDTEEFWFHDGRLLFRGNNGTGKSKVLSLTLPFLFDANLRSSRVEPDGDSGKKMSWNLLVGGYKRRIGYTWIEFGRRDRDGNFYYVTLGAGLSAVEGKPNVEAWFFILSNGESNGSRINRDFQLVSPQGNALTRERLHESIEGHGKLFSNATQYRRAVDEKLFSLGERRYDALMDTLIQLRQPQLSRKPDEAGLSHALTEALPPMPADMLTDVADSLNQLEEDRRQLDDIKALHKAVSSFNADYERYACIQSRRQARVLRQAQTEFDNASASRNAEQAALDAAIGAEASATKAFEDAQTRVSAERARQETLRANPTMQDANRLQNAKEDHERRMRALASEEKASEANRKRLRDETARTQDYVAKVRGIERMFTAARNDCVPYALQAGVASEFADNPLIKGAPEEVGSLTDGEFDAATSGLRIATTARRDAIATLRQRARSAEQANVRMKEIQRAVKEAQEEMTEAVERRAEADMEAEREGQAFIDAWTAHSEKLVQLEWDAHPHILALTEWVAKPDVQNPAKSSLELAHRQRQSQFASGEASLIEQRKVYERQVAALQVERDELSAGRDAMPPAPYMRGEQTRPESKGTAFYRLVDFRAHVDDAQRAGIEAALEASGLLDAWVAADGIVRVQDGQPWLDTYWASRPTVVQSLADWLEPDCPADSPIPSAVVYRLLSSVACTEDETAIDTESETWVSPSGKFRLGSLSGQGSKALAMYIGQHARAQARARRLEIIRVELQRLDVSLQNVLVDLETLAADRRQADLELSSAPTETEFFNALQAVSVATQTLQAARARLDRAEVQCRDAEQAWHMAVESLQRDAADLRLPTDELALASVEEALVYCIDKHHDIVSFARDYRRVQPDLVAQEAREREAQQQHSDSLERLSDAREEAQEAAIRFETLRDTVGTEVEILLIKLDEAKESVTSAEYALTAANEARRTAGERRATAAERAKSAQIVLDGQIESRMRAVVQLQHFAASSLLASALPRLDLPDASTTWTIESALAVARRIEQELVDISDDDNSWTRVQKRVSEDLTDLQRTLGSLGHQAVAETSDWGLIVYVIFHGKQDRPDQLAARLADEIAQRGELLSAHERAVLENHLQAEIATEIQRMLRAAEAHVNAVNKELEKRPTSTGVRYRLRWQPLTELEGAPVGLDIARERLLNTSTDLWSMEDRRVVGNMLHLQIKAERDRADSVVLPNVSDTAGSLFDQLSRALDYRRWHRFRVERLQAGQWKKLSGPASSGERALGLTVPLFAAIASFYSQSANPYAPRLMLLDEAFAGIDDPARAHCMGLIREFDLDFVITSEREWACYATLPGVAICHLQRREGVDAVFVSRWIWDGKARRRGPEPERMIG